MLGLIETYHNLYKKHFLGHYNSCVWSEFVKWWKCSCIFPVSVLLLYVHVKKLTKMIADKDVYLIYQSLSLSWSLKHFTLESSWTITEKVCRFKKQNHLSYTHMNSSSCTELYLQIIKLMWILFGQRKVLVFCIK